MGAGQPSGAAQTLSSAVNERLPNSASPNALVAALMNESTVHHVGATEITAQSEPMKLSTQYRRMSVGAHLTGSYADVKQLLGKIPLQFDNVALDHISLHRASSAPQMVDAEVSWNIFYKALSTP